MTGDERDEPVYTPTREEIERCCAEIQAGWSEDDRERRTLPLFRNPRVSVHEMEGPRHTDAWLMHHLIHGGKDDEYERFTKSREVYRGGRVGSRKHRLLRADEDGAG